LACLFRENAHHFVNSVYYAMYVLPQCVYNEWTRKHIFISSSLPTKRFILFFCAGCWTNNNKKLWGIEEIFETWSINYVKRFIKFVQSPHWTIFHFVSFYFLFETSSFLVSFICDDEAFFLCSRNVWWIVFWVNCCECFFWPSDKRSRL